MKWKMTETLHGYDDAIAYHHLFKEEVRNEFLIEVFSEESFDSMKKELFQLIATLDFSISTNREHYEFYITTYNAPKIVSLLINFLTEKQRIYEKEREQIKKYMIPYEIYLWGVDVTNFYDLSKQDVRQGSTIMDKKDNKHWYVNTLQIFKGILHIYLRT